MFIYQLFTYLLIFSLPFFPKQFADDHIKYLVMLFSFSLLPIFFPALLADIKRKFIPTLSFLVFLIPLTISSVFSIDSEQSIIQLRLFLSYFVVFVSIRSIFSTFKSKELLAFCFLLFASVLSIIALYNTLIRQHVNRENISFLWVYFGHNHLSALLIFAIPLSLYFLLTHWERSKLTPLFLTALCFFLISLFFTFSIGAMLALVFSFLIVLISQRYKFPLKKEFLKIYLIVSLILALFTISSLYFFSINKGVKTINLQKNPYKNVSTRLLYWHKAFDNFIQKPFTGSGLETFHIINKNTRPPSRYTHNFFIEILTDSGIFGFVTCIILIGSVFWQAYNTIKTTLDKRKRLFYVFLSIGLLSAALLANIDVDWQLPTIFLYFWVFAGLLRKNVN